MMSVFVSGQWGGCHVLQSINKKKIKVWAIGPSLIGRCLDLFFFGSGVMPLETMRPLASFLAFYHRAGRLEQ